MPPPPTKKIKPPHIISDHSLKLQNWKYLNEDLWPRNLFFLKMFTILKVQKELIDMAKKLTPSPKNRTTIARKTQFLGENSLRRLPKKPWHHHQIKNNRAISRESENPRAVNHKQCITKTNMLRVRALPAWSCDKSRTKYPLYGSRGRRFGVPSSLVFPDSPLWWPVWLSSWEGPIRVG